MERRKFLKAGLLSVGALIIAGPTALAKEIYKRDIPIFGPDLKTVGGRKHTPYVKAPSKVKAGEWFEVFVEVGHYHPHPNTPTHWIESVALWVDKFEVAKSEFKAVSGAPKALFTVRIENPGVHILRGFGYCNLHGLWVSLPVKVEVV